MMFDVFCHSIKITQFEAPTAQGHFSFDLYTKVAIRNLQTSHCYIFLILQHFAAKLCNFTNLRMLFLAVVSFFLSRLKFSP